MIGAISENFINLSVQKTCTQRTEEKKSEIFCFRLSESNPAEVETSSDNNNSVLFRARDNKMYNIKEILTYRFENSLFNFYERISNLKWYEKAIDWVKGLFNIESSSKAITQSRDICNQILYKQNLPLNKLFEEFTGEKFNRVNAEKFLAGDIKLKFETACEKFTGEKINTQNTAIPEIDGEYYLKTEENKDFILNKQDKTKYNKIIQALDKEYKEKLDNILERGILLNNDSSNKSSTLDILHKILTTPRSKGLKNDIILRECIDILDNPSVVTQAAEDIPGAYTKAVINRITNNSKDKNVRQKAEEELMSRYLGTCAAASIEYNIASEMPAEFINIIEQLTSPENKFVKTLHYKKDSAEYAELLNDLKRFKTPFKETDAGIEITLKPDKDAFFLALIQTLHKTPHERSIIDILTQSMIMNCGAKGTYNSITDKRKEGTDGGLFDFEISYLNTLLKEEKAEPNIYMNINSKGKIIQNDTIKKRKDLNEALSANENIIVGYVFTDDYNRVYAAHEITVIGETSNLLGEEFFICQDSDDLTSKPVCIPKQKLLKEIHHTII